MGGMNTMSETSIATPEKNGRRRRWEMGIDNVRYFLPKTGSSGDNPETGQVFYTVVAWRAMPEINGNEPRIVKQALSR